MPLSDKANTYGYQNVMFLFHLDIPLVKAYQSSVEDYMSAEYAIDGKINGVNWAQTKTGSEQWWMVKLKYKVGKALCPPSCRYRFLKIELKRIATGSISKQRIYFRPRTFSCPHRPKI